jgi:hypothetical protein
VVVSQIVNNSNLPRLRQRTEAEGEGKRRAEQERELERLRRILRENTGSHQEKDEVIAGKNNKIFVPDPLHFGTDTDPDPGIRTFD